MSGRRRQKAGVALVLVDVINGFTFEGSAGIVRAAKRAAPAIEKLAARARTCGVPVIYVNDNFGRWRSDFKTTIVQCVRADQPGYLVAARLRPRDDDYFVLKPLHSGFFATPLQLLLEHLGARTIVLAGFATNLCVAFTANDAHMLGYHLAVPSDCTASNTPALTRAALIQIKVGLGGDVRPSASVDFAKLLRPAKKARGQAL